MNTQLTHRNKSIAEAAALLLLVLLLGMTFGGRSCVASSLAWLLQTGHAVTELPNRIVTNIDSFSLDRLDPTCPRCI